MPVHRLIYEANAGDVSTVIVDGRILMHNRQVMIADEENILASAQMEAEATVRRAGLEEHMKLPQNFWGKARMTFDVPLGRLE